MVTFKMKTKRAKVGLKMNDAMILAGYKYLRIAQDSGLGGRVAISLNFAKLGDVTALERV
jgi:hypothetical protein